MALGASSDGGISTAAVEASGDIGTSPNAGCDSGVGAASGGTSGCCPTGRPVAGSIGGGIIPAALSSPIFSSISIIS